ncbi:MAG: AAA family ATPase [Bifidobacteriaceae bacterium]|nr:AAA family ATPase [Bifidobacteriaceae bacterium]
MTDYASQIHEEQQQVDRAYGRLDEIRAMTKQRLDAVRAAGSHGSPTLRTERDSFATMYEDRLTQLRAVEDRLVFGRLDDVHDNRLYIGRIGLSDDQHEPIVTDWRAEAARPFYEATPKEHGSIAMRRHITLRLRKVVGVEDEALDLGSQQVTKATAEGTLTGEGALMASLSSRRSGKMTDIVATIQAEQDRIIRADMRQALVVQGGPGTGKTAVALHRAAYLLYTHRERLSHSGVLIVGPSNAFLHYIDQVLPSLGETGVLSRTMATLLPGISANAEDSPRVAALKGDARMAKAIANAVRSRERVPSTLPVIHINAFTIPMRAADIQQAITDARRTRKPHNQARDTFVKSVTSAMVARYRERLDYEPEASELDSVRSTLRLNDDFRRTVNLAWLPMTAQWLLADMLSKPAKLHAYAPWLTPEQVDALRRPADAPLTRSDVPLLDEAMELLGPDPHQEARQARADREREHDEEIARETLAQNGIGNGIVDAKTLVDNMNGLDEGSTAEQAANDREWTFGHIVVDEAQELTPMDWRMLIRRCPSRSFTIVGDVAQTSAINGTRSWERTMDPLFGPKGWSFNELTIDYRNPQEVSQLATRFAHDEGLYVSTVSAVRHVPDAVHLVTAAGESQLADEAAIQALECAREFIATDGTGRVAVIADHEMVDEVRKAVSLRLKSTNANEWSRLTSQSIWDSQLMVSEPQEVKGLEFDAVILVQPGLIALNAASRLVGAADLYVAMTRPTQRLVVVRTAQDAADMPLGE